MSVFGWRGSRGQEGGLGEGSDFFFSAFVDDAFFAPSSSSPSRARTLCRYGKGWAPGEKKRT